MLPSGCLKRASPPLTTSSPSTSPLANCNLTNSFQLSARGLVASPQTEERRGGAPQPSRVPLRLIAGPLGNGFLRRTLCPSEEFNKLSDCLNSGGVIHPLCELRANTETQWEFFTLSILPLPVKQTFEGFCVACLYFTISKRCLLTGDLNYNHLDIRQASA